jgi:serine-type D-Ala-D-Ala carboxypeptidase (penicillin-binding protein 5/6)
MRASLPAFRLGLLTVSILLLGSPAAVAMPARLQVAPSNLAGRVPSAMAIGAPLADTHGGSPGRPIEPEPPEIQAASGVLLDVDSGHILWERKPHARLAPASLTKIFTAMRAAQLLSLDRQVAIPAAIRQLPWDSTVMGLSPGEVLSVRELLEGIFLDSGNDAAVALAGAVEPQALFVDQMNGLAASLGLADTHFVNPDGLDDPAHYSSAMDLATAAIALDREYPAVARIAAINAVTIPATRTHKAFTMLSLNRLLRSYPGATGLKTGWTGNAGGCLIATATRNGRHRIVVVMNSPRIFDEAAALLDYGFASPSRLS